MRPSISELVWLHRSPSKISRWTFWVWRMENTLKSRRKKTWPKDPKYETCELFRTRHPGQGLCRQCVSSLVHVNDIGFLGLRCHAISAKNKKWSSVHDMNPNTPKVESHKQRKIERMNVIKLQCHWLEASESKFQFQGLLRPSCPSRPSRPSSRNIHP